MAIATQKPLFQTLILAAAISLAACGGGGGGGKKSKDTTPDAFSFTASTNAATQAAVTSPAIAISGIDAPAAVSITGGEYSINGGAFTSAPGTVTTGQTIAVKVTASAATNTPVEAVLSVGGVRATFRVTTAPDVTPAEFSISASTDAPLSTAVTSSAVTLSGFDVAVPISITNGEYSINGGTFTSAAGTISPAQTLAVRVMSSNANSTPVDAVVTVGGISATYRVTTLADAIPNAFTFTPATNVALGSTSTSNTVTVEGIEVASPITITGGEYSINGGAFTSAAGSVINGQTVTVKAIAPASTESTHNAVVTIGGISGTYAVTTLADTIAPVAEFKFPTPYTMSEANSVKVRGTATDDHAITNVKVVVRSFNIATPDITISSTEVTATPKAVGDYSSWTAEVPLTALSENEIKVVATDDRNNSTVIDEANKVVVRQAYANSAFPDEVNEFDNVYTSILDNDNHRILVADRGKIWAVDIKNGTRVVFSDHQNMCNSIQFGLLIDRQNSKVYGACNNGGELYEFNLSDGSVVNIYTADINLSFLTLGMVLDRVNGRNRIVMVDNVYAYDDVGGKIIGFSLDSKEFSLISEAKEQPYLQGVRGGVVVNGDDYLVTSGGQHADTNLHRIISVNAVTGKHTVYADNTIGSGELFSALLPNGNTAHLTGMAIDEKNNKLIVIESLSGKLLSVDMKTGERSLLVDISHNTVDDIPASAEDLDLDNSNRLLYVAENMRNEVLIIDMETAEKVVLSKAKDNF